MQADRYSVGMKTNVLLVHSLLNCNQPKSLMIPVVVANGIILQINTLTCVLERTKFLQPVKQSVSVVPLQNGFGEVLIKDVLHVTIQDTITALPKLNVNGVRIGIGVLIPIV